MKKKWIVAALVALLLGAGCWFGYQTYEAYQVEAEKQRIWDEATRPFNTLTKVRGAMNPVTGEPSNYTKTTLVIFFNSECDHCQQEMEELSSHLKALEHTQFWFISFEEQDQAYDFLNSKGFIQLPDSHLFITTPEEAKALFGGTWMPQTFIYQDNQLITGYLGPVTFDEKIAPYL